VRSFKMFHDHKLASKALTIRVILLIRLIEMINKINNTSV